MEPKSGYKTSEFWLSLAAVLLGSFVTSGLLPDSSPWLKLAGIVLTGFGAFGYTKGRVKIKSSLMGLIVLMALPTQAGCVGQNLNDELQIAFDASNAAGSLAEVGYHAACSAAANLCVARGVNTPEQCKEFLQCVSSREEAIKLLKTAQLAILKGLVLAENGDGEAAKKALSVAREAMQRLWKVLDLAGVQKQLEAE